VREPKVTHFGDQRDGMPRMLNEQSQLSIRDRAMTEQFTKNKSATIDMFMRTKLRQSKPTGKKGAMESEVSVILST
jgi:hypothetical protein